MILQADARRIPLPNETVQCVVTSPPYWGLRDYGLATWEGGDAECDHQGPRSQPQRDNSGGLVNNRRDSRGEQTWTDGATTALYRDVCGKCGAIRHDAGIGLEATPEEYVANIIEVFREVWRVLRQDGTLWLNMGDCYVANRGNTKQKPGYDNKAAGDGADLAIKAFKMPGKEKDLVGIPWLVAKALQAPYYTGRITAERDRVWLAATVDGEGTICGFNHERVDGKGHRTGVHVFITNSNMAMLDEAERIWPASRSEHCTPGNGHLGDMPTYRWIVNGAENKALILRELWPYLVCKKKQAILGYNMALLMLDAKVLGHSPQRDEVRDKRGLLVSLMTDLNHARDVDIPSWCKAPQALYEPGWYLRSDIIWAKPNPMPESVRDRPTKAHEYLFLLSKQPRYYYDALAIAEPLMRPEEADRKTPARFGGADKWEEAQKQSRLHSGNEYRGTPTGTRNRRDVWTIATSPFKGAHFATFPPALVEPCILAGTSAKGNCPVCGKPWERVTEHKNAVIRLSQRAIDKRAMGLKTALHGTQVAPASSITTGWRPTCECHGSFVDNNYNWEADPGVMPYTVPAIVLDPFCGSGTVGQVCQKHGRRFVGLDLSRPYLKLAEERLLKAPVGLL